MPGNAMPNPRPKNCRPDLEALEVRWTPSAFHLAPAVRVPSAVAINLGVTGGSTTRGTISSSEVDYFLLTPKWTTTYEVRVNPTTGVTLDPVTAIYSSKGQRLALNDNAAPGTKASLTTATLTAGQAYYVAVTNQKVDRGGYTLSVQAKLPDDTYEDNDSQQAASSLGALSAPRTVENLVMADSADWYRFSFSQANPGAFARLETIASNGGLLFELYGENGARIALASSGNSQNLDLSRQVPGNYFLKVSGDRGAWNPSYTLKLDPGTPPPPPPTTPVSAPATPGTSSAAVPGGWTVLVYMTAGNLADFAQADVNELETLASTLPAGSRIGLFWDQWDQNPIATGGGSQAPWGSAGRAIVAADAGSSAIATNFEILGERDSGDPETLASFLAWGRQSLPAAHTALVLWNHGSGLGGSNYDSESADHLTIAETAAAIAAQNGWHPDILAYDACLMAMTENAFGLRQSADYLVASQESVDGAGFPYAQALSALANPNAPVADVVRGMVGAYGSVTAESTEATLSAVRLQGMDSLAAALSAFTAQAAQANATDLFVIRRSLTVGPVGIYTEAAYRDLRSFMLSISREESVTAALRQAADRVVASLDAAIEVKTADYRNSGGLSIYLPRTPMEEIADFMDHAGFIQTTDWASFVNQVIGRSRTAPLGGISLDPTEGAGAARGLSRGSAAPSLAPRVSWVSPVPVAATPSASSAPPDLTFLAWMLADEASRARTGLRR